MDEWTDGRPAALSDRSEEKQDSIQNPVFRIQYSESSIQNPENSRAQGSGFRVQSGR